MKTRVIAALLTLFTACSAFAELTILEDFDDLNIGTIDMQHVIIEYGFPVEMWNAQANTSTRRDSTWANVESDDGQAGQLLRLINRDSTGELDTVYTCMYLGYENMITDQGTVYLQYKANAANDCILAFNDNLPGYDSDVPGDPLGDETVYQGTTNYSSQSALVRLSAGQEFRARHDDQYYNVDLGLQIDTWYELWVQFDVPNKLTRYYLCRAGGDPTVIINPNTNTEWWGWRDDTNSFVQNIKIFVGNADVETNIKIDNIAIDHEFTTESLYDPIHCDILHFYDLNNDSVVDEQDLWYAKQVGGYDIFFLLQIRGYYGFGYGDFNSDGQVNIFDFLIFKSDYGKAGHVTIGMGDLDRDDDIDIFDFLKFKSLYGTVYDCDYNVGPPLEF